MNNETEPENSPVIAGGVVPVAYEDINAILEELEEKGLSYFISLTLLRVQVLRDKYGWQGGMISNKAGFVAVKVIDPQELPEKIKESMRR